MEAVQRKLGCGRTPASGMRQREQRTCVAAPGTRLVPDFLVGIRRRQ